MVDDPKKPFNVASSAEKAAESIRDKDNAAPDHKPRFSSQPAPNLAPLGQMGIRSSPQRFDEKEQQEEQPKLDSIVKTHPKPELLTGGRFTDKAGHGFAIEVSPYRSIAGIEGGKINQLEIQQNGEIVAQYKDMRWTKLPEKEEHKQLVQQLQDKFGEPRDFKPIVSPVHPIDRDKDRGHER